MNIFWFDTQDLANCAKIHPNKLIVKMQLEHCQLLASALNYYDKSATIPKLNGEPYKPTHINHPCAIWARASRRNFVLLCNLTLALANEYENRYQKPSTYRATIQKALDQSHIIPSFESSIQKYAVAINEFYLKCFLDDSVITLSEFNLLKETKLADSELAERCYRAYLTYAKCHYADWANNQIPDFWARQDADGRLFCPVKKHVKSKLTLNEHQETTSERLDIFNEVWNYNLLKHQSLTKPKMAKAKVKQICLSVNFCKQSAMSLIDKHFEAKTKSKPEATLTPPTPPELEECKTAKDYRNLIKKSIGIKVPAVATITRWLESGEVSTRVLEHIEFWLEKIK